MNNKNNNNKKPHCRGTIKRVGQCKSRVLFHELQVSF